MKRVLERPSHAVARSWRGVGSTFGLGALGLLSACSAADGPAEVDLSQRAYVVSEASDELFVVDLGTLAEVGRVDTGVGGGENENHMAVLSSDGGKIYVMATARDSVVVVDAVSLEVQKVIGVGPHTTHASACFGCGPAGRDELWVVNEGGEHDEPGAASPEPAEGGQAGSISVIDMASDEVVHRVEHESLMVPHFVRFSGGRAYVPSIGGNQISVVDLDAYQVTEVLSLEGEVGPSACSGDPCGFADAQIDPDGRLFAAHIETGRVLVYDTLSLSRSPDLAIGDQPWAVFVDTIGRDFETHVMPNWGDSTVSVLHRSELRELARSPEGDRESYGVNYSPRAPGQAFVLNRLEQEVAVIDRESGESIERLDVGGTTETGSTTADGKYLLLPISSSNEFRVLDFETRREVARFEGLGEYPWSVATLGGQNYCH